MEEGDADLVFTVLEMRSYRSAKQAVDNAKGDLKMTPAVQQVFEIELEAMKQDARKASEQDTTNG